MPSDGESQNAGRPLKEALALLKANLQRPRFPSGAETAARLAKAAKLIEDDLKARGQLK